MATLYTNGAFVALTPTQFSSYSLIRYSAAEPTLAVRLGFTVSGSIDFATRLGSVSAVVEGWTGADNIITGSGNDTLWGNSGNDALSGGAGSDFLVGDWDATDRTGNDALFGGDGNDELIGGNGNDALYGGNGDDVFSFGETTPGNDGLFGGAGNDAVSVRDIFDFGLSSVAFNQLVLNAAASVEFFAWDDTSVALRGTAGNDLVDLSGTTALTWDGSSYYSRIAFDLGFGSDVYTGGNSDDNVTVSGGNDRISLGAGNDGLTILDGSLSGSTLNAGTGDDTLTLGDLNYAGVAPVYTVAITSFSFVTFGQFEWFYVRSNVQMTGTSAADTFDLSALANIQIAQSINMLDGNDKFIGGHGGVSVNGGAGNDTLISGGFGDTLIGGAGIDSMVGSDQADTFEIDSLDDVIVENGRYGADTLIVPFATWKLSGRFENLTAAGAVGLYGTGTSGKNLLTGGEGNDRLRGLDGADTLKGGGVDTLVGGTGGDTYLVSDDSVTIIELSKQGSDTIVTEAASWTLNGQVENLRLIGDADAVGIGSATRNVMRADGTGHKTLLGMGGRDTLIAYQSDVSLEGGRGNDTYWVGILGGQIVEQANGGVDRADVYFGIGEGGIPFPVVFAYVLPDFVEQLYLHSRETVSTSGNYYAVTGTGNASDNLIVGDYGNDTLYGLDGNDTLIGGTDEFGATGDDGNDSLIGGNGDDTYRPRYFSNVFGGSVSDTVVEVADGGFDTIEVNAKYADLLPFSNVEAVNNSYYSGTGVRKLGSNTVGNTLDNVLITSIGEDTLYGLGGHDTLTGGAGNDGFVFGIGAGPGGYFTTESSDVITDFTHGADKLVLNYWSFSALGTERVSLAAFKVISGGGVIDASDRLLYDKTTGELFYDRDGSGVAERWLVAVLTNHPDLAATDFTIVL